MLWEKSYQSAKLSFSSLASLFGLYHSYIFLQNFILSHPPSFLKGGLGRIFVFKFPSFFSPPPSIKRKKIGRDLILEISLNPSLRKREMKSANLPYLVHIWESGRLIPPFLKGRLGGIYSFRRNNSLNRWIPSTREKTQTKLKAQSSNKKQIIQNTKFFGFLLPERFSGLVLQFFWIRIFNLKFKIFIEFLLA
jgi:hypothetical protein